ncbi:hypothetical protein P2318_29835 [Myxococcaceae bacterium GXIMD 01537]
MPVKYQKAIVTHVGALQQKYGRAGYRQVQAALKQLVAADKARGLNTMLVALDSATTMRRLRGKAVKQGAKPKDFKAAIDAVSKALAPEYLMILGAVDVVPHQDLINPASDDGDPLAYGDLPYACEARYSQRIEDFTAVTRVVGRLPDITGGKDPAPLVALLKHAASAAPRPASDYAGYLGMTAAVWKGSTLMSLQAMFGNGDMLQLVPPEGPRWTPALLQTRMHFINCHGAPADFRFYGQSGNSFPVAHDATLLGGGISDGTVVSAECCYGAELYDPAAAGGTRGMVDTYLANGAHGFFGSSTIAYGPADGNGAADLLCQFFLRRVLQGSSLGRAALQARQEFVARASVVDPIDLKTLAQFSLMGDPSIQPVTVPHAFSLITKGKAAPMDVDAARRGLRRTRMARMGEAVGGMATTSDSASRRATPPSVRSLLQGEVQKALKDFEQPAAAASEARFSTFSVDRPPAPRALKHVMDLGPTPSAVHLAIIDLSAAPTKSKAPPAPGPRVLAIVAVDQDGTLVTRRLLSR